MQEDELQIFEHAPDAMLLVDTEGKILRANNQVSNIFLYSSDELVGMPVEILMPERYRRKHVHHRDGYMASPRTRPMGAGLELYGIRKDGTEFPVDIMLSPLKTSKGDMILSIIRDVTERKKAEAQILEDSKRKATLLQEIHHRVKNNLQIISSLLFLQSSYVTDSEILQALKESRARIRSIALIHEQLYQTENFAKVDFGDYLQQLSKELFSMYSIEQNRIVLDLDVIHLPISIDAAIPCGLIINELISNSLKYAFPNNRKGRIWLDLKLLSDSTYHLEIGDNGVGLPKEYNLMTTKTLGLKLVMDLVKQLEGILTTKTDEGLVYSIIFKEPVYKERGIEK